MIITLISIYINLYKLFGVRAYVRNTRGKKKKNERTKLLRKINVKII